MTPRKFDTLLIANRGEIACRVIRTARRMGLRTVAVYSDTDAGAQHVTQADCAVHIGGSPASESYLNAARIVEAAQQTGAGAIHPGYGFLSENADFARACADAGIVFVGPSADAIRAMGSKIEAKDLVQRAGAPVVPGYLGDDQSDAALSEQADAVGYPLLIKASAGGGGKGMRLVREAAAFADALAGARREAAAAFGDDRVLLERFLEQPKHLEVQILADTHGNAVHLLERDCSVQRRHQKVIEEAPGPTVDMELRNAMGQAALQAARSVGYVGAGTVEFIAEDGEFFFMEMNTRLQVEHPVTEMITGLDLVEWQLRIAAGEPLSFAQSDIAPRGHAIEVRVYAEDPAKGFLPATGKLVRVDFADDVRVDTGVATGDVVSMYYDPMLAKVIAHGNDRDSARAALVSALRRSRVVGPATNLAFLIALLNERAFVAGDYTTGLVDELGDSLLPQADGLDAIFAAQKFLGCAASDGGPWSSSDGFRVNLSPDRSVTLRSGKRRVDVDWLGDRMSINDRTIAVSDVRVDGETVACTLDGLRFNADVIEADGDVYVVRDQMVSKWQRYTPPLTGLGSGGAGGDVISSPMPGQVIRVLVQAGEAVDADQAVAIVEAMKMEHTLVAPRAGTVASVECSAGDKVVDGARLVTLAPAD